MLRSVLIFLALVSIISFLIVALLDFLVRKDFFLPFVVQAVKHLGFQVGRVITTVSLIIEIALIPIFIWLITTHLVSYGAISSQVAFAAKMIKSLGVVTVSVIVVLLIMSAYSIAIMVERYLTYSAARKQSNEFAPRVAKALREDRIDEAINISDKHRKSHLAMVVSSGLHEFRAHEASNDISGDEIDASRRALERAIAIKTAEFKRGLSGLATIGSTAPFVGLFGTVFGIINAFRGMRNAESAGIEAVSGGISEALFTTALGLLVAVPAVWLFNYFTGKVDGFIVEMDHSASELVEYFIQNRTKQLKY